MPVALILLGREAEEVSRSPRLPGGPAFLDGLDYLELQGHASILDADAVFIVLAGPDQLGSGYIDLRHQALL